MAFFVLYARRSDSLIAATLNNELNDLCNKRQLVSADECVSCLPSSIEQLAVHQAAQSDLRAKARPGRLHTGRGELEVPYIPMKS